MTEVIQELILEDFDKISGLLYRKTGIRFETKKLYFISNRILKRIKVLKVETVGDYIRFLQYSDVGGLELQELINLVTINETYFFRDFPQLQVFAENCLTDVVTRKIENGDKSLKIWCAGCSSGEEPYSLGIILKEILHDTKDWDISITASDIDRNILDKAEKGIYDERSVKDTPFEYLNKYFTIKSKGFYEVKDIIKNMVNFELLNLSDNSHIRSRKGYDFIFCRNVLIYFDDVSRRFVVDHFYNALKKGGYIFLGSSESLSRITTAFKLKRMNNFLVYCKE